MKKHLPTVTLVAVACTRVKETVCAMRNTMAHISFKEAVLITHEKLSLDHLGIKVVMIEKLDYKHYNHFIIYRLKDYISTEIALHVQNDGYVLRPEKWSDEFLEYDYIGAPWPKDIHWNGTENVRVGNGGFALRSKKLLEAPTKLGLPFTDNGTGFFHEDGILCVFHRNALRDDGIRFATVEVAARFSTEIRNEDSVRDSFGYHKIEKNIPLFIRFTYFLRNIYTNICLLKT